MGKGGPGAPDAAWRILYKVGPDKFVQVGQMKQRPRPDDLELAMINASASQSPLTKTVAWAKGLMPGGGGGKK